MENKILTLDKRNSLKEKKKRKKKVGVPKYKHKPKLFLNHRADDSVHASPASPGKCRQSRKVSGVASLPINGGRVFYARTDPRYEITPVTPAGRKKFEGVVAGAWKPFVSLSLRRFVERGAVYHRWGLRFLVSPLSLSLSEGHQINHSLSSLAERFTSAGYSLSSLPRLASSPPQSANNSKWFRARIHNLWNAL